MIAHVGLNEADARKQGIDVGTCVQEFRDVDRAIRDGTDDGFVKVHVKKGTAQIVSATIVADHADECSVTGVTSNPTIFHDAIKDSRAYDDAIGTLAEQGKSGEDLCASTGTKDPQASDVLYVEGLVAPLTINTMPEGTLKACADHGETGPRLPLHGGDCEAVLTMFATAGVDIDTLASRLQDEGAASFVTSWNELIEVIASKTAALRSASE